MFHESSVQLGKQGVTENFIRTLEHHFKNHRQVKISVLKNARENKDDVKNYAGEIVKKLGLRYSCKNIGFTIIVKKGKNPAYSVK